MMQERPVRVERRLAAILAADVAGYSRLMHRDEEDTHARLTFLLREAVLPAKGIRSITSRNARTATGEYMRRCRRKSTTG